jgi:hypothetical protein
VLLAAITDYFFPWHLLVILGYTLIWLVGGYWLTLKALNRFPDLPKQMRSPAKAFTLNVAATGLGQLGALVLWALSSPWPEAWRCGRSLSTARPLR